MGKGIVIIIFLSIAMIILGFTIPPLFTPTTAPSGTQYTFQTETYNMNTPDPTPENIHMFSFSEQKVQSFFSRATTFTCKGPNSVVLKTLGMKITPVIQDVATLVGTTVYHTVKVKITNFNITLQNVNAQSGFRIRYPDASGREFLDISFGFDYNGALVLVGPFYMTYSSNDNGMLSSQRFSQSSIYIDSVIYGPSLIVNLGLQTTILFTTQYNT